MAVLDGTHLFQWQADEVHGGDVNAMITEAKALGITGVLIKFANGNLVGDPISQKFMDDFKRLAPLFKAAGLKVGGWIYQYLTDPAGEADACFQAIEAGAECIVLDAEKDVNGKGAQVQQFGQLLRAKYPNIPVGLSSYAIASYHDETHGEIPFNAYAAFVDFMMPQIYWADMGWDVAVAFNASVASYKKYCKPIAPTGQAYEKATSADMARFVQLCNTAGYTGVSWWDWQHATADHLAAIKANLIAPPAEAPVPAPQPSVPATQTPVPTIVPAVSPAKDVAPDAWYLKHVDWAIQEGIMHNDGNGYFNPDKPLTRAEAAALMYNNEHRGN